MSEASGLVIDGTRDEAAFYARAHSSAAEGLRTRGGLSEGEIARQASEYADALLRERRRRVKGGAE